MNGLKHRVLIWALGLGLGGQLGASQAVECWNNIPPSNPNAVYQDHGNGTVTDTRTDLMWKQCSEGQTWSPGTCTGDASRFTWHQALAHAETATFAGYADWRLPNIKELRSLVEECRLYPAINDAVFPAVPTGPPDSLSVFWSASPCAHPSPSAWHVYFSHGLVSHVSRSHSHRIRLVRGGP